MKRSKPVVMFIILACFTSWLVFVLLALNHRRIIVLFQDDSSHTRVQDLWHSLGALGPILAARKEVLSVLIFQMLLDSDLSCRLNP